MHRLNAGSRERGAQVVEAVARLGVKDVGRAMLGLRTGERQWSRTWAGKSSPGLKMRSAAETHVRDVGCAVWDYGQIQCGRSGTWVGKSSPSGWRSRSAAALGARDVDRAVWDYMHIHHR
jgi:hypothetical protein